MEGIMAGTTMFEMPEVAHSQYFSGNAEGRRNGSARPIMR